MFPGEYFCRTFFDSGYWPGTASPPDIPGVEYTASAARPHFQALGNKRPHYEAVEE